MAFLAGWLRRCWSVKWRHSLLFPRWTTPCALMWAPARQLVPSFPQPQCRHALGVLARFKNSTVRIYALQINALLKISFLSDELKLASLDGGFCCRLLTSAQPSQKSVLSMRSLLKLGDLKVVQLSEQAEVPVFWNTASGCKTGISICKSHFKCLRFVTWYVTWFWDIYQKKKRIQQLVWELKLYSIPQWSKKFRDKQKTEPACLGVIWSSWGWGV